MNKSKIIFSLFGSILVIIFLVTINQLVTPSNPWSIYPSIAFVFWPVLIYHFATKKYKMLSVVCALLLMFFMIVINYLTSWHHPWYLYVIYPILWWPILMFAGKWKKKMSFACLSSLSLIAYYVVLNVLVSPIFPWSIFTTFVFLWWPIIHYGVQYKRYMSLAVIGTFWMTSFFSVVNYVTTPGVVWAVYPIFVSLWWPISVFCFDYLKDKLEAKESTYDY